MLKEISWESYWTFIAFAVGIYYLILFLLHRIGTGHFSTGFIPIFWSKQHNDPVLDSAPSKEQVIEVLRQTKDNDFLHPSPESPEYPVYNCVDEVNAYLESARSCKGDKTELVKQLRLIVSKYPTIKDSDYKESLSNVIVSQCEHLFFIHLDGADMDRIWAGDGVSSDGGETTLSGPAP